MHCLNLIAFAAVAARRELRGLLPSGKFSTRFATLHAASISTRDARKMG
jgi:hypothetical protein